MNEANLKGRNFKLVFAKNIWICFAISSIILLSPNLSAPLFAQALCGKQIDGFIKNQGAAIKIGRAILESQYGEKRIKEQLPLKATFSSGVWTIEGTMKKSFFGGTYMGGVAELKISSIDGRIISLCHGQ